MAAVFESDAILRNMARMPDITVAAVTETDGRFLVVEERINRRLVFNQPAGHVEQGETLLDAVVRETREETAWGFEPQQLLGVYLWRNPSSGRSTMRSCASRILTLRRRSSRSLTQPKRFSGGEFGKAPSRRRPRPIRPAEAASAAAAPP